MPVHIPAHNRNDNYPPETHFRRLCWSLAKPLFRFSPRPLYAWRNWLLRRFGAHIGANVRLYPTTDIMFPWNLDLSHDVVIAWEVKLYSLALIRIEDNVLISQGAHLCAGTHDYRLPNLPLLLKPITIETGTWLAADCFIGPGVTVGRGAVVGARAVVVRDVPALTVVAGNPARPVGIVPV